jgi:hypothetical protein
MSMSAPLEPNLPASHDDDGIPAADAGTGAPPPAEGFGVDGEDPDRAEGEPGTPDADLRDPPFRTPDPREVGRG